MFLLKNFKWSNIIAGVTELSAGDFYKKKNNFKTASELVTRKMYKG